MRSLLAISEGLTPTDLNRVISQWPDAAQSYTAFVAALRPNEQQIRNADSLLFRIGIGLARPLNEAGATRRRRSAATSPTIGHAPPAHFTGALRRS